MPHAGNKLHVNQLIDTISGERPDKIVADYE
jgi:hypothetical protein